MFVRCCYTSLGYINKDVALLALTDTKFTGAMDVFNILGWKKSYEDNAGLMNKSIFLSF